MKIEHIAIWTEDIDRLKRFYVSHFGAHANEKYTNHKKQFSSYFLEFQSGCRLELMEKPGVQSLADRAQEYNGLAHFAVSLGSKDAVDAMTERLR